LIDAQHPGDGTTAGITLPQAAEPCHEGGKNTLASGMANSLKK
jgi:hypothetical protein